MTRPYISDAKELNHKKQYRAKRLAREARARKLTKMQKAKLLWLDTNEPGTTVIGWHEGEHGPIVLLPSFTCAFAMNRRGLLTELTAKQRLG